MSKEVSGFVAWIRSFLDDVYANITHTHSKSDITDLAENVFYGTCSSLSTAQIKEVTVSNWSFTTGNILFVKFDDYNKFNGTAQIKINNVTKDIATVGTTKTSRYYWKAGEVVGFVYDGTNMVMLEQGTATTTYYGITKLSSSTTSTSETLSATPKAVKTAYDLANEKLGSSDVGAVALSNDYGDLDNKPSIPSKISDLTNDSDFIETSSTSGLVKNDGSIDTTQYLSSLPSHNHDDRYYTESEVDTALNGKQATLVSGTNIKTVNGNSLLGSGDVVIGGTGTIDDTVTENSSNPVKSSGIYSALSNKANTSHNHDTWTAITLTHGTLYVNTALRMCELHYSTSKAFTTANTWTFMETITEISNYPPKTTLYTQGSAEPVLARVFNTGSVQALCRNSNTTLSVTFNLMWHY